ncbi:MAG: histidine kinase [Alphaproteobacteria bacterium]|nr:histidine kinase [Alphaproteobacteria bacterium]
MTKILISPENPKGLKLEAALVALRNDVLSRCSHIVDDPRPPIREVLNNNLEILRLLSQSLEKVRESEKILSSLGIAEGATRGR